MHTRPDHYWCTPTVLSVVPADVQPYVINAAKVLFLRPRPQPRAPKGAAMPSRCVVDGRQLMDAGTLYCSIR